MKIIFKNVFILSIFLFLLSDVSISQNMKVVIGEASLTTSDAKRFKRYGNDLSKYKELREVWELHDPSYQNYDRAANSILKIINYYRNKQ